MKRSRRFNNENSAKNFANKLGVEVKDLRSNENRNSNFKVEYTKQDVKNADFGINVKDNYFK